MLRTLLTQDGGALVPPSRAALMRVLVLRETVALCKDLSKLELGPGVNTLLYRVASFVEEQDTQEGEWPWREWSVCDMM